MLFFFPLVSKQSEFTANRRGRRTRLIGRDYPRGPSYHVQMRDLHHARGNAARVQVFASSLT
jgi:hypothetical protein